MSRRQKLNFYTFCEATPVVEVFIHSRYKKTEKNTTQEVKIEEIC